MRDHGGGWQMNARVKDLNDNKNEKDGRWRRAVFYVPLDQVL
jgi:hypothetical protein